MANENELRIEVRDKIATLKSQNFNLVGGNSDYNVVFDFDEDWADVTAKTAIFIYGKSEPVYKVFDGNVCEGVAINDATMCLIGVVAGNVKTTTPACVECIYRSIADEANGVPQPPTEDVYNQIMELLNKYIAQVGGEIDASKFVPRMAELGDTLAEEYLGNKYHRMYCERNKKDIDGDGILDERGTYARICITEIPIPPPDPDIYSKDADPALIEAYNAKQYGEHISLHSIPLRTYQGDLRVPARTIEEAEALDPSNAKEFAVSIAGAKKAFVPKLTLEEGDSNRYAYTVTRNSKGEMAVQLIKMGANPTADVNQPLIRRRTNGAVGTLKNPQADDDAASKLYVDTLGNSILEGLDSIITAQNELLGG